MTLGLSLVNCVTERTYRWLLGFRFCGSSSEGAAVIRLARIPFPRVQEPTVLEASEEERVVAEEEEAVRQAQVGARRATMLSGEEPS